MFEVVITAVPEAGFSLASGEKSTITGYRIFEAGSQHHLVWQTCSQSFSGGEVVSTKNANFVNSIPV
jgi:hypothetical protein